MSVDMLFELDADLPLSRLIFDKRMFQQLFCARPHCVVLDQTHFNEVVKLLGPSQHKQANYFTSMLPNVHRGAYSTL